eukprot:jgi/Tetstr1/457155/TSEL_043805.t1
MARAADVTTCRRRRRVVRSANAGLLVLALLLCEWRGLASGFLPEQNQRAGIADQIVGGRYADPKRYPYIVSLRDPDTRRHLCAGALIKSTMVLTAAHCVDDRVDPAAVEKPLVVMGWECDEGCSAEDKLHAREETSGTINTIFHQDWRGSTEEGADLALLVLKHPMTKPVLLVLPQPELWDLRHLLFVGWGKDSSGRLSKELRLAELPYRPNVDCQLLYQQSQDVGGDFLLDDMMCAGGFGESTCQGDSGGPLILAGDTYREDVAVGILSFGAEDCAGSTLPSVFTRLSMYQSDLAGFVPQPRRDPAPSTPAPTPAPIQIPFQVFDSGSLAPSALSGSAITFTTPTYAAAKEPACWAAVEWNGTIALSLGDDSFEEVPFSDGFTFPFYGQRYGSVFVGSNGYLTFGQGDTEHNASAAAHGRLPRVSALFADLVPDGESSIRVHRAADIFAVSYRDIKRFNSKTERASGEAASEGSLLEAGDTCPPHALTAELEALREFARSNPSQLPSWLREGNTACDFEGVECNAEGLVTKVDLSGYGLTGALLPSWSALTAVEELRLNENRLRGALPPSWSALKGLHTLELNNNRLTGPLPPSWTALTRLSVLDIWGNALTGALPPSWSALTGLGSLFLYENQLTGPLPPSWSALTGLGNLYLQSNQLTGPLPPEWSTLTGLRGMSVSRNQLTGPLPRSWSTLTTMEKLYLHYNQLTGRVPSSWSTLNRLTTPRRWLGV